MIKTQPKGTTIKYRLTAEDIEGIVSTNHKKVLSELNTLKKQGHVSSFEYTYYDRKQKRGNKSHRRGSYSHNFTVSRKVDDKIVLISTDLFYCYDVYYDVDSVYLNHHVNYDEYYGPRADPLASLNEYEELSAKIMNDFMPLVRAYLKYKYYYCIYTTNSGKVITKEIGFEKEDTGQVHGRKLGTVLVLNRHFLAKLIPWLHKVKIVRAHPPSPDRIMPRG